MKRFPLTIIIITLSLTQVKAQLNIVANGSFEQYSGCPTGYSTFYPQITYSFGWTQPTFGTSDYFNSCAAPGNDADVPKNFFGKQTPRTGNAYAGLFAYLDQTVFTPNLSREYLQTKVTRTLKANRNYYFEMYVSLADKPTYRYTVNNLGACLTPNEIKRPDADAFQFTPQVLSSTFLDDTSGWMRISGTFIANGGENFLTIGRFGPNDPSTVSSLPGDGGNLYSYYYIDDVKLIDSCAELDDVSTGILGNDTDFCQTTPVFKTVNASNSKTKNYLWSTGHTSPTITIITPGSYWVRMSNGNCVNFDTINISNTSKPDISLGYDTAICFNQPVKIEPRTQAPSFTYKWSIDTNGIFRPAGNSSSLLMSSKGLAMLEVNYSICKAYDTIDVFKSWMSPLVLPTDTTLCRNTSIILDALTPGALIYKWNTGATDPQIESSKRYLYWAEISDGLCKSRDSIQIFFKGSLPVPLDTSFCKGSSLTLISDPGATSTIWSTGATTPAIVVHTDGLYVLKQTKDGCSTFDSIHVVIDSIPEIELGPDTAICNGTEINLMAWNGWADHYLWNTGETDPYIVVSAPGKYEVTIINSSCTFIDSVKVTTQIKEPFSLGPDTAYCFNVPVTVTGPADVRSYLWNTGDSDSALIIKQAGTYWLKVSKGVCESSDTLVLQQEILPVVDLGNDTSICVSSSIVLDALNPGSSFLWNDASTLQLLTVAGKGNYSVQVTNDKGCLTIDSIKIDHHPEPALIPNDVEVLCKDSVHTIHADLNMISYLWEDGSTLDHLIISKAGIYRLTSGDAYGCIHPDSVIIIEKPRPEVLTEILYEACEPDFYAETSIPYKEYIWQDGSIQPTFHIQDYGYYSLTVTDSNNCRNTAEIEVKRKCIPSVIVPNVFSPNNDGKNDRIIPQYTYIVKTDFVIYNRWGQVMFNTSDLEKSWDGSTPSGIAEPGVYYYTLKCTGNEDQEFKQTGTITLIR